MPCSVLPAVLGVCAWQPAQSSSWSVATGATVSPARPHLSPLGSHSWGQQPRARAGRVGQIPLRGSGEEPGPRVEQHSKGDREGGHARGRDVSALTHSEAAPQLSFLPLPVSSCDPQRPKCLFPHLLQPGLLLSTLTAHQGPRQRLWHLAVQLLCANTCSGVTDQQKPRTNHLQDERATPSLHRGHVCSIPRTWDRLCSTHPPHHCIPL